MVEGYALVFDKWSDDLGGFRERVARGAVHYNAEPDDALALFNHDRSLLLARLSAGTLKLEVDSIGLRYRFSPGDNTASTDLVASLERGDVNKSSFSFYVRDDTWTVDDNGDTWRTLLDVLVVDVAPVTSPAYPQTSVYLRSDDADESESVVARARRLGSNGAASRRYPPDVAAVLTRLDMDDAITRRYPPNVVAPRAEDDGVSVARSRVRAARAEQDKQRREHEAFRLIGGHRN